MGFIIYCDINKGRVKWVWLYLSIAILISNDPTHNQIRAQPMGIIIYGDITRII